MGHFLLKQLLIAFIFNHHVNPAILNVTGDVCISGRLNWGDAKERNKGTWADLQEATEYGGYGVAIIVAFTAHRDTPRGTVGKRDRHRLLAWRWQGSAWRFPGFGSPGGFRNFEGKRIED